MSRKGKESSQEGNSALCRKYHNGEYVCASTSLSQMHSFLHKCVNKMLNRPSPFTPVPCREGKCSVYFKSQAKHQKMEIPSRTVFWFLLCLLLTLSGCHRGQDQLRTTFESGSLKQPLFQKEENITRGICK